jgi:hypothetical protein
MWVITGTGRADRRSGWEALEGAGRRRVLPALAEGVGFEPTVARKATTVFETVPIVHSGTPPWRVDYSTERHTQQPHGNAWATVLLQRKPRGRLRMARIRLREGEQAPLLQDVKEPPT